MNSTGDITTDDTGGRHLGNNGYVTHIGNEFFAWFQSSDNKSQTNFLNKLHPQSSKKEVLEKEFERIFTQKTSYQLLNAQLKRLDKHKSSLLRVLDRPELPLHINGSENELREQVKGERLAVVQHKRSDLGQQCRDTFSRLKQTCRKLNISFWQYLQDRLSMNNQILPLRIRAGKI